MLPVYPMGYENAWPAKTWPPTVVVAMDVSTSAIVPDTEPYAEPIQPPLPYSEALEASRPASSSYFLVNIPAYTENAKDHDLLSVMGPPPNPMLPPRPISVFISNITSCPHFHSFGQLDSVHLCVRYAKNPAVIAFPTLTLTSTEPMPYGMPMLLSTPEPYAKAIPIFEMLRCVESFKYVAPFFVHAPSRQLLKSFNIILHPS